MNEHGDLERLLADSSAEQLAAVFRHLRSKMELGQFHSFETSMNAKAEVILEALSRAGALNVRAVRGVLSEATFFSEVVVKLEGWSDETPVGDLSYDAALKDAVGTVRVQVKLQRREKGFPLIKNGGAMAELQRTRNGKKGEADTRPYRFGEFDLLAVCMEPSHKRWDSFMYLPARWLLPRTENDSLIKIMQPVALAPDEIWTNDFATAVERLRGNNPRPIEGALFG